MRSTTSRILSIVALVLLPCIANAKLLEQPWPAPQFALTDQHDKPVASADLKGHIYLADFFFTTCAGPCPLMTQKMVELMKRVDDPEIRFVGFSVDPETDTPSVLRSYAQQRGVTDSRLHLLTGPKARIQSVAREMLLAFQPGDASHQIIHSDRFMLIDEAGKIRGTYRPLDPESFEEMVRDIRALRVNKTFPAINAALNAASGLLLVVAYLLVRRARYVGHVVFISGALVASAAFLTCYLVYHYLKAQSGILLTKFPAGGLRPVYLVILTSHTILAAIVLPMIAITVNYAIRRKWESHRRIARWTFWTWLYVSVTGVVVYLMLYQLAPKLASGG